jgi:tRNA G18 (ribose-2'-O)-methylase SpoU
VPVIRIEDGGDPRLAAYGNVPDHQLLAEHGLFVAEGRLVVRRLIETRRFATRSIMVTPAALVPLQDLLDTCPELPVYLVPQFVMNGITGFNMHRGCLALGERPHPCRWQELVAGARLITALERVGNADNVGSVFRSASAFGVDAVLLERSCTDPLYRKAIRTSMGAALTMPFATAEPWPDVLRELASVGRVLSDPPWVVLALTPSSSAPSLAEIVPEISGRKVVIVAGHEGDGVSDETLDACTHHARIPMADGVDSLNVATAAAIALYALTARDFA